MRCTPCAGNYLPVEILTREVLSEDCTRLMLALPAAAQRQAVAALLKLQAAEGDVASNVVAALLLPDGGMAEEVLEAQSQGERSKQQPQSAGLVPLLRRAIFLC